MPKSPMYQRILRRLRGAYAFGQARTLGQWAEALRCSQEMVRTVAAERRLGAAVIDEMNATPEQLAKLLEIKG